MNKIKRAPTEASAQKTQTPIVAQQIKSGKEFLPHPIFVEFAFLTNSKKELQKKGIRFLKTIPFPMIQFVERYYYTTKSVTYQYFFKNS